MTHYAGFVNIIGRPNAGKSTLMNLFVGEKLSIITPKAQTTRHRILGIMNDETHQVVFSDTPGILETAYGLHRSMMTAVMSALNDADVIIYLVDMSSGKNPAEEVIIEKLNTIEVPVLLVLNKLDLINETILEQKRLEWSALLPKAEVFAISALESFMTDPLKQRILSLLPENPPFYDKDALTDRNMRFIASEIIREKILLNYQKEVPYSTHVDITSFKEEPAITRISAVIYVARETQKGILIGDKGSAIKKVGIESRLDIEKWLEKKVYLELNVKVSKDWRNDSQRLKNFGYES